MKTNRRIAPGVERPGCGGMISVFSAGMFFACSLHHEQSLRVPTTTLISPDLPRQGIPGLP